MAKKYNINSKSDMRRFQKDLEKIVKDEAVSTVMKEKYEVTCPHCQANIKVPVGKSSCPNCRNPIDLKLNIKW